MTNSIKPESFVSSPPAEIESQVKLVDVDAMAGILGVGKGWLYRRTMQGVGAIPHYKVGKHVRFDPKEVLEFVRNGKASGNSDSNGVF